MDNLQGVTAKKGFFLKVSYLNLRLTIIEIFVRKLLVILCLLCTAGVFAQTNVSGIISTNTTWNLAGSPYIVVGNVLVDTNKTLIIEPGVVVKFNSQRSIQNKGTFIARGTASQKIIFTSNAANPAPGDWKMLEFTTGTKPPLYDGSGNYLSGSIIRHAEISYGGYGTSTAFNSEASLYIDGVSMYIDHTEIKYSQSNGIIAFGNGNLLFKATNCSINNVGRMGFRSNTHQGTIIIDSTTFTDITTGEAIYTTNVVNCQFTNNLVVNCGNGYAVQLSGTNINVKQNVLYKCPFGGIEVTALGMGVVACNKIVQNLGGPTKINTGIKLIEGDTLRDNIIADGIGGISIESFAADPVVFNNQLVRNSTPAFSSTYGPASIFVDSDASAASNIRIINNLFFNNKNLLTNGLIYISDESWSNYTSPLLLTGNNFIDTAEHYYVKNYKGNTDITADNNWWGTTNTTDVDSLIYDWLEDASNTFVRYSPLLSQPNTFAPISPPTNVIKMAIPGGVQLTWDANIESDLSGYRVHYGSPTGYSFSQVINAGNVTSYQLLGASLSDTIAVTSFDGLVNGLNDQCDGNESWYSFAAVPCVPVQGVDVQSGCSPFIWIDGVSYTADNSTATYTYTSGAANGCDSVVTLNLTLTGPNAVATVNGTQIEANYLWLADYRWLDCNNGFAAIPGATGRNFTPAIDGNYAVEITSFGCLDTSACVIFGVDPCANNTWVETITSCDPYTWRDGITYTNNNYVATYTIAGGAFNGCDSIIQLDLTINNPATVIQQQGNMLVTYTLADTYQWLDCNNNYSPIAGATGINLSALPGNYALEATIAGCKDTSVCMQLVIQGVQDNAWMQRVIVYPNPTQGKVYIEMGAVTDATVKVYSIYGQLIYEQLHIQSGTLQLELNEAAGVYFIEISEKGQAVQYKLILD